MFSSASMNIFVYLRDCDQFCLPASADNHTYSHAANITSMSGLGSFDGLPHQFSQPHHAHPEEKFLSTKILPGRMNGNTAEELQSYSLAWKQKVSCFSLVRNSVSASDMALSKKRYDTYLRQIDLPIWVVTNRPHSLRGY